MSVMKQLFTLFADSKNSMRYFRYLMIGTNIDTDNRDNRWIYVGWKFPIKGCCVIFISTLQYWYYIQHAFFVLCPFIFVPFIGFIVHYCSGKHPTMLHDYLGWELTLENLKPKHSYKNPRGYTCINRSCLGQLLKCKIITHQFHYKKI